MGNVVHDIGRNPVQLDAGAGAAALPDFDGSREWFERYGGEGRLVTMFSFSEPWDHWEVHPHGHELVLCVSGAMTLLQELPSGEQRSATIGPGQYVINEPGTWHTADVDGSATGLFVTAGQGTDHRPR